jgi:hypothetical protein
MNLKETCSVMMLTDSRLCPVADFYEYGIGNERMSGVPSGDTLIVASCTELVNSCL